MLRYSLISSVVLGVGFLVYHLDQNEPVIELPIDSNITLVSNFVPQDGEAKQAAAQKAYDALQADFQKQIAAFRKEVGKLKTKQEQVELLQAKNPSIEFAAKHLELAKRHTGTKAAMNAVLFVVGVTKGEKKNEAMMYLLENYSDQLNLDRMADSFKGEVPSQDIERWYLKMIDKADTDSIKASVMYHYAKYVSQFGVFKKTLDINPQIAARLPKEQLDYIVGGRSEKQKKAMADNLRAIIANYGDIKKNRTTYGALAKKELFDLERLQVGQEAPDIVGKDLDGVEFRLSDYRGKVVLLDFWGHWCPPCRAMYSTEQEINLEMADTPFVLLGVNSDRKLETAKNAVEDEGLSWRHFWNGPKGTAGPISEQWNVEGWPTFYLIDGNGIIRYKQVSGKAIETGIEKLMAELGHDVSLDNVTE